MHAEQAAGCKLRLQVVHLTAGCSCCMSKLLVARVTVMYETSCVHGWAAREECDCHEEGACQQLCSAPAGKELKELTAVRARAYLRDVLVPFVALDKDRQHCNQEPAAARQ